jgi:hypothetical protein
MGAEMLDQGGYFSESESEVDEDIPLCQECSPIEKAEFNEDEAHSGPKSIEVQTSPYIGIPSTHEQASQWSTPEDQSESKVPQPGYNLCWCNACNRPSGECTICPTNMNDGMCGPFSLSADCIWRAQLRGKRGN